MNVAACEARYGRYVSEALLRRVWAAVTKEPQIRVRPLAAQLGYRSCSDVSIALRVLRDAGYIDFADRSIGTRQIIVPFYIEKDRRRWTVS